MTHTVEGARGTHLCSVVVPAHDEERAIGRLLELLDADNEANGFEIVVVCNGCTDGTADVARGYRGVVVVETPVASKAAALRIGDERATTFPRVYLDADVEITQLALRRLTGAFAKNPQLLAVGPARVIPRDDCSLLVRGYYDVWERLPQVKAGLFGRGVIALSREGNERVRRLPQVMSDDLAFSEAFSASERGVASDAQVVVRPPQTLRDLVRRRIRVRTGIAQIDDQQLRGPDARTGPAVLLGMAVQEPWLLFRLPAFVLVTVLAHLGSRRAIRSRDFTTWLRDESSRAS